MSVTPTPAVVNRYLYPREVAIAIVRRHPAVLLAPVVEVTGVLLVAAVISSINGKRHEDVRWAVWSIAVVMLMNLCLAAVDWATTYFAITNSRLVYISGFFRRKVAMTPLPNTDQGIGLEQTLSGRLLGYGTLIRDGGSGRVVIMDYLPYPEQVHFLILQRLYPDISADGSYASRRLSVLWPESNLSDIDEDEVRPDGSEMDSEEQQHPVSASPGNESAPSDDD